MLQRMKCVVDQVVDHYHRGVALEVVVPVESHSLGNVVSHQINHLALEVLKNVAAAHGNIRYLSFYLGKIEHIWRMRM